MVSGRKITTPLSHVVTFIASAILAIASFNVHAGDSKVLRKPPVSCRSVSEFTVRDLSFAKMDTDSALRRLIEGTPFSISYSDKISSRQISAAHVTGDLASVLSEFGDSVGISWVQKDCHILVSLKATDSSFPTEESSRPSTDDAPYADSSIQALPITMPSNVSSINPTQIPPKWTVRRGQRFSDAMADWCKKAGCLGLFWETGELESELPQSFEGSFEEAVTQAIETLASQGIPIRAVFYSGNGVVRIMGKK